MRYHEIVAEEVRPNIFYHGTAPDDAVQILMKDRLNASTSHKAYRMVGVRPKDIDQFESVYGVSLTRSPLFARKWKSGEGIVFGLDGDKIKQKHRILQRNYYENRSEAEEFVVGPIDKLSLYLVSISMSKETYDWCRERDDMWGYAEILEHPLLRIEGDKWDAMTGRIVKDPGVK